MKYKETKAKSKRSAETILKFPVLKEQENYISF
jgi:hypothetical protein